MAETSRRRRFFDVPTLVQMEGPAAVERAEAETFVREAFDLAYGARIEHFLPTLMALRNDSGRLLAVLGLRETGSEPLFLEHYLDRPVEQALSAAASCPVDRDALVEVGNFAVGAAGGGRWLITALTAYLYAAGHRWTVFTCGPELQNAFRRLGSAIGRERQFTADAAHELRTPLAALKTHLQVARARSAESSTRASLDKALEGVDRATRSVEQLLMLARADAEQTKALLNTPVDLREIALGVVSSLSQQAIDRDIDLGVDAPDVMRIRGDATALHLMLRNLVDNAVRYTPMGGMVTVGVGLGPDGAWVEVVDDGVGVAVDERAKIFNRFHRGVGEQARGTNGSGLGLSIVKRIADLHGAGIVLGEGLNGKGLRVKVVFAPA